MPRQKNSSTAQAQADGSLRIIAGRWRRRRLHFPARAGVRPTPDRVRETLFNWLAPSIHGARCLDLFAGSGALGLEALSRGAAQVIFVDNDPVALKRIGEHLSALNCDAGEVWHGDWHDYLALPDAPYDVVFADPPFGCGWLEQLCTLLVDGNRLNSGARVYLEYERGAPPVVPASLTRLREAHAGQVGYALLGPATQEETKYAEE